MTLVNAAGRPQEFGSGAVKNVDKMSDRELRSELRTWRLSGRTQCVHEYRPAPGDLCIHCSKGYVPDK